MFSMCYIKWFTYILYCAIRNSRLILTITLTIVHFVWFQYTRRNFILEYWIKNILKLKTHCINCYSLEIIVLMTGKIFSMAGKWPGIILVDENGHPALSSRSKTIFEFILKWNIKMSVFGGGFQHSYKF